MSGRYHRDDTLLAAVKLPVSNTKREEGVLSMSRPRPNQFDGSILGEKSNAKKIKRRMRWASVAYSDPAEIMRSYLLGEYRLSVEKRGRLRR